jgi:hypothetical protein
MPKVVIAVAALALVAASAPTLAQQDKATIVVQQDPTVAAPGQWKAGGSIEFWTVREEQPGPSGGTIERNLQQAGWSFFAGYSDFTLQSFTGNSRRSEDELVLRWLITALSTRYFVPYLLGGYAWIDSKRSFNATDGSTFACSGTGNQQARVKFDAPMAGIGAIFPFNERLGLRVDGRYKPYNVNAHADGCADVDGGANGGDITATGYYNFGGGWNAQLGARYQSLPGIPNAPAGASFGLRSTGLFGMLGYTYAF